MSHERAQSANEKIRGSYSSSEKGGANLIRFAPNKRPPENSTKGKREIHIRTVNNHDCRENYTPVGLDSRTKCKTKHTHNVLVWFWYRMLLAAWISNQSQPEP